jgi:ubiquitin C-terminal hydrolase
MTKEMANLYKHTKGVVRPFNLKKAVSKELPEFSGFDQCDAQEFLTFFLNQMSEDLNRKPSTTAGNPAVNVSGEEEMKKDNVQSGDAIPDESKKEEVKIMIPHTHDHSDHSPMKDKLEEEAD